MKERERHIDFGAGLLVLWMIVYHAWLSAEGLQEAQRVALEGGEWHPLTNPMTLVPFLLFFMPWFFYKAGMLFRTRPQIELAKYDARKLLKPWLIWSLVGYACYVAEQVLQGTVSVRGLSYSVLRGAFLTGRVPINEALWFLLTLFAVRQIANGVIERIHPLLLALIGMIIAYVCHKTQFALMPDWIANTGIGLCFFSWGYYQTHRCQLSENLRKGIGVLSGVLFVGWCVVSYILPVESVWKIPVVDMYANVHLQGVYLLWFPISLMGIIVFNRIIAWCADKYLFPILSWFGVNAMLIYVIHCIPCRGMEWVARWYLIQMSPWMLFWVIILLYALMICGIKIYTKKSS